MILVFDVGNTSITAGIFDNLTCIYEFRLPSRADESESYYLKKIKAELNTFAKGDISSLHISNIGISSVVPKLTVTLVRVSKELSKVAPYVVVADETFPVEVRIDERHTVGSDRVVNAFAVREKYGTPAVVVDYGTATTFDVISGDGAYIGGVIAPGIQISHDALVSRTAQLPQVELEWPPSVIGECTKTAIQSGLLFGHLALTNGILDEIEKKLGPLKTVVATGGYGMMMKGHTNRINYYEPQLTLWGLAKLVLREVWK